MFSDKLFFSFLNTKTLGRKFSFINELESTNDFLLNKDTQTGEIIVAAHQTKGKGRSGREWFSSDGALMFSIVLPHYGVSMLMPLNILAGFAVVDSLKNIADVKLKWPNDCVINGKKVCGMLIDCVFSGSELRKCVLGIGVNLFQCVFPNNIEFKATYLSSNNDKNLSKEYFLAYILNTLEKNIADYENGDVDIVALFPYYSANIDKTITIHRNGELFTCIEKGIKKDGSLLIELEDGSISAVCAGEIGYDFSNRYR